MGIRGFGSLFGDQQSGDVANVGIDLFFDMLFDSLSKVSSFIETHFTRFFLILFLYLVHSFWACNRGCNCDIFCHHGIGYLTSCWALNY